MSGGVLIAGIGNLFLTDDGFGSEVARRLAGQPLPDGVRVIGRVSAGPAEVTVVGQPAPGGWDHFA